ncbi:ROK family protein [Bifidobacterium saguinibicoloris]|uniref:ROK family protein n=1 Tax=Bifidobacterium saguinibicoloris TaxID=2834433 RepID=UPI001C56CB15|nr:ROK family protein [Bifidobacterium saguinibicoloris]MBW3081346.1 ROK family protein [Bifidobacterium saguinibicoloris]
MSTQPNTADRNVAVGTNGALDAARGVTVRNHNLSMIANAVVTGATHPSRADLARMTGLNRSTMTRLVEHLVKCGIIHELGSESNGAGRPAVPLAPALHTYASIGVDISTGSIEATVVDLSGETLAQHYQQLSTVRPQKTLNVVRRIIDDMYQRAVDAELTVVGITVALRGLIDANRTYLLSSPNLGWSNIDLLGELRNASPSHMLPQVSFMNAADAGAYAETYLRNKQGRTLGDYLYVSGGVGIDTALVTGTGFDTGSHGWAGELGHVFVAEGTRQCSCGNTGCLESFAGQHAIMAACGLPVNGSTGNLFAALSRKEPEACKAVDTAAQCLGIALSAFVNICDVSTIVLDGLYAQLFEYLEPPLQQVMKRRVLSSQWADIKVLKSVSTNNTVALGAAWKGMVEFLADPDRWQKQSEDRLNYYPITSTPSVTI